MAIQQITSMQAHELLSGDSAILVDVREPAEHRQCHISSAHLVPLSALHFDPSLAAGKDVIIHCQKGVRGNKACEQLSKAHPELTFLNVEGGIEAWQAAGLAVQKGQSKVLPLDRQVQLTVGTGIVTGVVLSQTVAPEWVWLAGFFGAGLLFAGATGFCGLARALALMPWNR
jgi:rhodanese-related sulfurtransferase